MSITPRENEALDRQIELWGAKIARSSGTTVEAIVTHAENVCDALRELRPLGRKARQLLAEHSGLSRPMISKLEAIGAHAGLLRRMAHTLPPSLSSLYALVRKPLPEFEQAVMMDLRGKTRTEIRALFAPPPPRQRTRRLLTVLVPPDLGEAGRCVLVADISAALIRIIDRRRVDLDISLPAQLRDTWQSLSPEERSLLSYDEDEDEGSILLETEADVIAYEERRARRIASRLQQQSAEANAAAGKSEFFTGEKNEEPEPAPASSPALAPAADYSAASAASSSSLRGLSACSFLSSSATRKESSSACAALRRGSQNV
jgi:hypothetical protein